MRKSNIVLLIVTAGTIGLLGYTNVTLRNRAKNNMVRVVEKTYNKNNSTSFSIEAFHHIVVNRGPSYNDEIIIVDSAVVNSKGQPGCFVVCYTDEDKKLDPGGQFRVINDTVYIDCEGIESATIFMSGLGSVMSLSMNDGIIRLESIKSDKLSLYAYNSNIIQVLNCKIGTLYAEADTGGKIGCDKASKIDTIDFDLRNYGRLGLNEFSGHIRNVYMDSEGALELEGSSVKAFSNVKWN